jgi:hypothetical protein
MNGILPALDDMGGVERLAETGCETVLWRTINSRLFPQHLLLQFGQKQVAGGY